MIFREKINKFHFDVVMIVAIFFLLVLGIIMVTSSSIAIADRDFAEPFYYWPYIRLNMYVHAN